ncbi:MAG: hypothetical protein GOVbin1096_86 [Prokaryotic dsDNA virus sp.]|jgi:hypothetical protein|nr:MAG: hypothetical protein GOVbin1096_86 [Prokaryotic dsDNA virus sp.]|tara:strand:- start:15735 stop:16103 length:369 start_codon:yes stop_codon:yes gene_type:complete
MSDSTKFKPGQSGNPKGRPSGTKKTARQLGADKLKKLLKALEGYADDAILTAANIMQDEEASQATRLKAAMTLLQKYTEITGEVYFNQLPKDEEKSKGGSDEDPEEEEDDGTQKGKLAFFSK